MKYKDWLKEWLDHYIEPTAKIRTFNVVKRKTVLCHTRSFSCVIIVPLFGVFLNCQKTNSREY